MIRLAALTLGAAMVTAACTPAAPPQDVASAPAAGEATLPCSTDGLDDLLGRKAETILAEAQRRSGAGTARILRPNMVVTMEYRADRLNVHSNVKGEASSFRCG